MRVWQVLGVWSTSYIPKGTRFGPLVGQVYTKDSVPADANRKYFWRVRPTLCFYYLTEIFAIARYATFHEALVNIDRSDVTLARKKKKEKKKKRGKEKLGWKEKPAKIRNWFQPIRRALKRNPRSHRCLVTHQFVTTVTRFLHDLRAAHSNFRDKS